MLKTPPLPALWLRQSGIRPSGLCSRPYLLCLGTAAESPRLLVSGDFQAGCGNPAVFFNRGGSVDDYFRLHIGRLMVKTIHSGNAVKGGIVVFRRGAELEKFQGKLQARAVGWYTAPSQRLLHPQSGYDGSSHLGFPSFFLKMR